MALEEDIVQRKTRIAVIGLGYVGLPLAVEFARVGFKTTGIDVDKARVEDIRKGHPYILDVSPSALEEALNSNLLDVEDNYLPLQEMSAVIICVPTPLGKTREPDISYIVSAVENIARFMKKGQLIVLESTTYPGTTEEVVLPMLERQGLQVGRDFFLAFSPERVDPGNKGYTTRNIPKIIGGITPRCTSLASLLYGQIVERTIPVSSSRVAEMVKLLENTFRSVNIGLVNELSLMCDKLSIDVWEVIEAARTKPFGFMSFYPGPGIGGHCINIDPLYLSWKARLHGFEAKFIELAAEINARMPYYVVEKMANLLNGIQKPLKSSRILIVGVTYKADVNDIRESPALEIIRLLNDRGAEVSYYDPYIPKIEVDGIISESVDLEKDIVGSNDLVAIITDHSCIDYEVVRRYSRLILDTRNVLRKK